MKRMTMPLKRQLTAQTLAFAVMVFGLAASADYTLERDETWNAADVATNMTGVINLNGHTLTVPELKGNATITDASKTYELLEYIRSTGVQYIDTGVTGKPGLTASADFAVMSAPNSNNILLGSRRTSGGANRFYVIGYKGYTYDPGFWFQYNNYGQGLSSTPSLYTIGEKCHVEAIANNSDQKLYVEGQVAVTRTDATLDNTGLPLYLFDANVAGKKGGFGCLVKLYAATISTSDGERRNFVPARRCSDGKVGLLDLANRGENEFYTNKVAGTDFTAGAVTNYIFTTDVATASSELHVEVLEGETRTNETVTLSGALKLVKKGAGTFVAAKSGQTYLDGTVVEAGTFRVAAADEKTNSFVGLTGRAVTVGADATLDVNGNPDFTSHPLVLAGGTLKNGATTAPTSVGAVTLTEDSTILAGGGITHTVNVVLDGKALTVSGLADDDACYRLAEGVSYTGPGTVSVSGGILSFDGTTARNMRTIDLTIASAVNLSAPVTVSNLTSTYTGSAGTAGTEPAKFLVAGTYTASSFHRGCEMQNGSTLDLSALTGPVSNVTFAADAAITVALGTRTLAVGDEVVSWAVESKPSDTVTFETELEGSYGNKALEVRDQGLYLAEADVAHAVWTGADPTDVNDPANWQCASARGVALEGRIPSSNTVVTLPAGCTNSFPVGGAFLAREVKLPATLGADNLDWRGITAPFSGTLDLQGKKLTVSRLTGDCEITDTANVEYELLEYIRSTGTQYINTGVVGKPGLTITTDFAIQTISANSIFIGSRKTKDGENRFYPIGYTPTYYRFWIQYSGGAAVYSSNNSCALQHKYHAVATASSTAQTLEIVDMETGTSVKMTDKKALVDTEQSMYLFNANVGGGLGTFPCAVKFYGMAISTDEGVRRDFVPVRQISTGKVGLLDLANRGANEFYENKGTGTFAAGAVTGYVCGNAAPGELHIEVAKDEARTNETVTLSGALKLVKDGAGTFVAAKTGQTYAGGTEVAAGTFQVAADDESANRFVGASGSSITVDADATLDVNGNIGFEKHPLVLAGGTVKSSGTSTYLVSSAKLGDVTLTANSTINPNQHIRCSGLFDLGTHTLTLTPSGGKYFEMMAGSAFTNGLVNATTGGYISFAGAAARDMGTVDLWINCGTKVEGDITVRDLALGWTIGATSYAYGDGSILINGTFTPRFAIGYHRNCVMQNGSTLNLAEQAGAWPLEPDDPPSGMEQACTPLAFAENATINVTLGARRPKSGPIVSWDPANEPAASVTFVLDPAVNARLVRKPGGLWLQTGFLVRIR